MTQTNDRTMSPSGPPGTANPLGQTAVGGTAVEVAGVSKSFGAVAALRDVGLVVPRSSTTAILGPSGCGKTTLLRVIAGFERPDSGSVKLGGEFVAGGGAWVPAQRRDIGYVAQEGSLFPHLNVARNVAFGLPRGQRKNTARIVELLALVSLDESYLKRYPHELSGGQQQRVALARALARRPQVVLLDEPFAALDAGLRASTRTAVAEALAAADVTTVLVTHDQAEALSFADQVAVMSAGQFSQVADARTIYDDPADLLTAQFVGDAVLVDGNAEGDHADCVFGRIPLRRSDVSGPATVMIRPEQLRITTPGPGEQSHATVLASEYYGHDSAIWLELTDAAHHRVTARLAGSDRFENGASVRVSIDGSAIAFASEPTRA